MGAWRSAKPMAWAMPIMAVLAAVLVIMIVRSRGPAPSASLPPGPVARLYDISEHLRILVEGAKAQGVPDDDALRRQALKMIQRVLEDSATQASVDCFAGRALVICLPEAHEEVRQALAELLQAKGQVATVDVRVITFVGEKGENADEATSTDDAHVALIERLRGKEGAVALDDTEADALVRQALATGMTTSINAPRVTHLGGACARIITGNQQAYVRGYRPGADGAPPEPDIDVVTSGLEMLLQPMPRTNGEPSRVRISLRAPSLLRMDTDPCTTVPTTQPLFFQTPVMDVRYLKGTFPVPNGRTIVRVANRNTAGEERPEADTLVLIKLTVVGPWRPPPPPTPTAPPAPPTTQSAT